MNPDVTNSASMSSIPATATELSVTNFTPRALRCLALALEEARRLNFNFISTEHVFLGLLALGEGGAVTALRHMNQDLDVLRQDVVTEIGTGHQQLLEKIPHTPRVGKVLALAAKQSKALQGQQVGTEHILLGLLLEGDNVAARKLQDHGVTLSQTLKVVAAT
jgi:ATP-dependent Clp protease ATP-binding subunit ClpC